MMFLPRRYDKEIMDDFSITDGRITRALDELRTINAYLGGASTSKRGIRTLLAAEAPGLRPAEAVTAAAQTGSGRSPAGFGPVTVLDVGAGGSEALQARSRIGRTPETIISVDINAGVCRYIKASEPARSVVCADASALPFGDDSVDIVHVSLFLHHFREDEIEQLLSAFLRIARRGVVINDLRRSVPALAGITLLTKIFSTSAMVRNDAPLSVKKGFLRRELVALLRRAPCSSFTLERRWAFRWLAVLHK